MSLDLNTLEEVRALGSGVIHARCPACAEGGHDRTGEHLRIYPDGRFGCCVHPKDREHRKRIFALAGDRRRGTFSVRVEPAKSAATVQSVKGALTDFSAGTLGTGKIESEPSGKVASQASQDSEELFAYAQCNYVGTFGTPFSQSRAYGEENSKDDVSAHTSAYTCKDWNKAVPSVPESLQTATGEKGASNPPIKQKLPHFTADGTLSIPFDSPERYHWWRGGQSVKETIAEILERKENYASLF
jgi:hypothetical protein